MEKGTLFFSLVRRKTQSEKGTLFFSLRRGHCSSRWFFSLWPAR
jgi:hypothetical protein